MPLALPDEALARPKLAVARADRSSVFTPAPPPPAIVPLSEPALPTWKTSAPVPPVRLATPLKLVVVTPSLTLPLFAPATA